MAANKPTSDTRQFQPDGVRCQRLKNGLAIVTREDQSVPIVSTMIWYRVGSRFEEPGIRGMSHFLEHMMFKGTDRYQKGEIDYITTRLGGSNNAFTSNDYTAYHFTFASDRWWPALEIEADRMINNSFDATELELERQVVIEELKMQLDSPWSALCQLVESRSYQEHPYQFPVIGVYEDLISIDVAQMVEFYERFYTPGNAVMVLVGDFRAEEVVRRVEELFGSLSSKETPEGPTTVEPDRTEQVRLRVERPSQLPRLMISFPAPSVRQKEHFSMHVLDRVLSEGKLSRLYSRLVEKEEVASFVTTEFSETYDRHLFSVRVELRKDADLESVEALVFEEMDKLRKIPISQAELRRAKNQCFTQLLESFETTLDQAVQLGLMEALGEHGYWNSYMARVDRLTVEEVRDVVQQYWTPEQATVGILPPTL